MGYNKNKERLDQLMLQKELVSTRSRARAEIMAGNVFVNGEKIEKPGTFFSPQANIELRRCSSLYVSRGGDKLEKAINEFGICIQDKIVLDIGASTGGFTHCLLEHGAEKVYALDVGYGQLAWQLRNHPRVKNMERVNVRYINKGDLEETPHMAVADVSFISLKMVFPVLHSLNIKDIVALVKPQFEASPQQVGKKGVVKDKQVQQNVLENVIITVKSFEYGLKGLTFSPLKGPQGNIEYLIFLSKKGESSPLKDEENIRNLICETVNKAHKML